MRLTWISGRFAICRLDPRAPFPEWACGGPLSSITRTDEELSLVCDERKVPEGIRTDGGWRALKIAGPMDLSIVGVLASITAPLADAGVCLFAVSTFDTDYLLVREAQVGRAEDAIRQAGHEVGGEAGG